MRMLITRPEPDAEATKERLAALDIAAAIAPVMTRQTLQTNLPTASGFAASVRRGAARSTAGRTSTG